MTVQELHYAVDQGLQKVGSYAYDNFLPEEIDLWLNRGQEQFIKDRAFQHSDKKQIGFTGTQKRLDDLRLIIRLDYTDDVAPQAGVEFQEFNLPLDYLYLINIRVSIYSDKCKPATTASPNIRVPVRIVNNKEIYFLQQDPFARSNINSPLAILSDRDIKVFQDSENFILEGIEVDYIRTPQEINLQLNQTSELAEHTHQEIVDLTVTLLLESIESQRYQTSSNELLNTE